MDFNVHLFIHDESQKGDGRLDEILKLLGEFMSQISDFAAKVEANYASLRTEITALDASIQALQAQLTASGTLSPTDTTAMQALVDDSAALVTQAAPNVSSGVVTPPTA
jgi:hypothetical protein